MDSRKRLLATLAFVPGAAPPRCEGQFSDQVVDAWRRQGVLGDASPEEFFGLDQWDGLPVTWRRTGAQKYVVHSDAELAGFRQAYDPLRPDRLPDDWPALLARWKVREHALEISPWDEGFLQVLGIADGRTLDDALIALCEQPDLAEAQMDCYVEYLEQLIARALADVQVDLAVYYEPIASNHGLVISPQTYRCFVWPALYRIVECLRRHGVRYHFIWSSGRVAPLIPLWLEAGINGFVLNHAGCCGLSYGALRQEYGPDLRFFGGVDWRALYQGPRAIDAELDRSVRPVLEQGGYVPYLDDTVRGDMPFERYRYYRERLDALCREVLE